MPRLKQSAMTKHNKSAQHKRTTNLTRSKDSHERLISVLTINLSLQLCTFSPATPMLEGKNKSLNTTTRRPTQCKFEQQIYGT